MSFFFLCYSERVVAVRKDKVMFKNKIHFFAVQFISFLVILFFLVYINVTKNILDLCYFFFVVISYFRIKCSEWKKYH